MKFGDNFDHLSIPEWRIHNLDYNTLKAEIRRATEQGAALDGSAGSKRSLRHLNRALVDEFDRVSLFAITKYGELSRRLAFQEMGFALALPSGDDATVAETTNSDRSAYRRAMAVEEQIKVDDILYQCFELSRATQDLLRFVLMQKIATRKMFKKFQKHYPHKHRAHLFVDGVKDYLYSNEHSFFNLDMSSLTLKLSELIRLIKEHRSRICDDGRRRQSPSLLLVASINRLAATSPSPLHAQQKFPSAGTEFDLNTYVKKNFHVNCIVPDETNSVNETLLHLSVNLGLDVVDVNQEVADISILFLADAKHLAQNPSYIISDHAQEVSTIIAYTGGLRNYSYCVLPNTAVQLLLDYLAGKSDSLKEYFHSTTLSLLTKLTIETIIKHKLAPGCRVDFQRHRYVMKKDIELTHGHGHDHDDQYFEGKTYLDDYCFFFDKNIRTTTNGTALGRLGNAGDDTDAFDIFPYAHLLIFSNDLNLSAFSESLETPIQERTIGQNYSSSLLRKLPVKVQDLLTDSSSLTLVQGLSFYHYMLLCYFNVIVDEQYANSDYSLLLDLNLLKNYEQVETFRNQRNAENRIHRNNSLQVLHHQNSLRSLNELARPGPPSKHDSVFSMATTKDDLSIFTQDYSSKNGLLDELVTDSTNDEDPHKDLGYFAFSRRNNDSLLEDFIVRILRVKRAFSRIGSKKRRYSIEVDPLEPDLERNYGSINDNYASVGNRTFTRLMEEDFDHTLSYFYFSLFFIALFVCGVELGIVYSLLGAQDEDSKLLMSNNLLVVLVLLMGLFVSLIFSMISINLNVQRYNPLTAHTRILWSGFGVVSLVSIWCVVVMMEQR